MRAERVGNDENHTIRFLISSKLKKMEESAQCKKNLEEALASQDEAFRKTMLEALEKNLKELK